MTKIEELRTAFEAARDSDSTGECRQYEDEFLAVAFHAMPALLEAVEALEDIATAGYSDVYDIQQLARAALAKLEN